MITIDSLSKLVCAELDIDQKELSHLFKSFVRLVGEALEAGHDVQLRGLCTFRWTAHRPIVKKLPDGSLIDLPPRRRLKVNISERFKFRGGTAMSDNDEGMEKYGVQLDDEKVKQASKTKPGTCTVCGATLDSGGACPIHGTEPFERRPEK